MTLSVTGLASALQTLLTDVAEQGATDSGFLRRRRRITGAGFVRSLVLGWMSDPRAKLDDLADPLGITPQALQERFTPRAVACLQRVLQTAMTSLFQARPETIPLLRRFPEVVLEDSTTCTLPASLAREYPGCGGSDGEAGQAGLKILVQLEAITGRVRLREPAPARDSDRTLHLDLPPLPQGSLRLVDLGFFDLERMARDTTDGIFWISRVPARLTVQSGPGPARNINQWLLAQKADRIDTIVTVGVEHRQRCRLVAVRVPAAVARQRLQRLKKKLKKKGRKLSAAQRVLCEWTVLITNLLDAERFPAEQLWVLYGVRWQVELLFKRWKSGGGLGQSRGRTAARVLCEFLAKLLGVLLQHWGTLLRGGPLSVVSATRAAARVRRQAERLAQALGSGSFPAVVRVLEGLKGNLDRLPKRPRRARPTTRQLLFAPRFGT
jgi:Transposase DDE domain